MIKLTDIEALASARDAAPAIVDGTTVVSWAEYARSVRAARDWLGDHLAPEPGRPVRAAVLSENRWELVVLASAFASLGVPWVGLDHTLDAGTVARCLAELGPACVVRSARHRHLAPPAAVRGAVAVGLDGGDGEVAFGDLMAGSRGQPWPELPFEAVGFTSGTTGRPKLVLRTRPTEARRLRTLVERFRFDAGDVHLVTVPMYHASAHGWARIFLAVGGTVVLGDGEPDAIAGALVERRVTTTLIVPPALERVVAAIEREPAGAPGLRFLLTGGRHLSPGLVTRCERVLGPVLHEYYGTTETGVNTIATPAELAWWPHSAGRPFEGTRLAVLAPDLTPLPPGRAGRVAVSSYMNMDGYASHPTPEVRLDGERHLVTGDHGWLDRDGRLYLLSREDGLPEAGSGDVFGVEGTLKAIAGVRDVALVRLPHDGGTTLVAAYVDGDPDRRPSTAERLRRSLRRAFPGLSTEAAAVPGIPYSPTGKVRVETLRAMLERPAAPAAASMEVRS